MSKFEPTIDSIGKGALENDQITKGYPNKNWTDFPVSEKGIESVSDEGGNLVGKEVVKNYRGIKEWIETYRIQDLEDMFKKEGSSTSHLENKQYESILKSYKGLLSPFGRYTVRRIFGIRLADFSIRVQLQFLNFLNNTDEIMEKRVAIFLKNGNSTDRLKSFLSLEQGGADMGEKILAIGEKLPKEAADTVFAKYAEMAEATNSLEDALREYSDGEKKREYARSVGEQILLRAKNMLVRFAESKTDTDTVRLLRALDRERASVAVFLATCKILRRERKMPSLEELPGVRFGAMTSRELALDPELLREMRSIYEENYAPYPEEFRKRIVGSLDDRVAKDTVFYLLQKDGQLLSFDAFTKNDDGRLSFGSFNIAPEAQGNALAEAMIESTVLKHGEEWKLVAECDARKPISKKYIEHGFFVKDVRVIRYPDGSVPVLTIERDPYGFSHGENDAGETKELSVPLEKLEEVLAPFFADGFAVTHYDNRDLENIRCTLERR